MKTEHDGASNRHRRQFLASLSAIGVGTATFQRALVAQVEATSAVSSEMIQQAEWIAGIELDEEERQDVASSIESQLRAAEVLRAKPIDADTVPAFVFRPDFFYALANEDGAKHDDGQQVSWSLGNTRLAKADHLSSGSRDLAFASIQEQASLLAQREISSRQLTTIYLDRLKKYDPLLKCVVTLLEGLAIEQADASDKRRAAGKSRGILDGIPWVAKDLIAVPPWKTTWGAEPFKDQVRNVTATVAERLREAGAVLLAKVTLGALAWGDKWFGGMTRNPWNPRQGSSGSSAGSAAAVAAGLAAFALGSETLGSIISPTRRCRTSGLRPTFGRVSRFGCMPLAWSMDKIGPIARNVDDLAYVFHALLGPDGRDPTLVDRGFTWPRTMTIRDLRIGVTGDRLNPVEDRALTFLEHEGANIVEVNLESDVPVGAMNFILGVEASTVFDDVFRAEQNANFGNWPSTFRQTQFVPAIQYVRANRIRSQLITQTEERFTKVDVILGGNDLLLTNLTGHPSLNVACGTDESRGMVVPGIVKLTAAAYRESLLLHVGKILQQALPPAPAQPPLDQWVDTMESQDP